jgi:endonuclease G, mitochondrial
MKAIFLLSLVWLLSTLSSLQAQNQWGSFKGLPIQAQLMPDGFDIQLLADISYTDPNGVVWPAPKGLVSDGASIPQAFWSIIGGPLDGKYRNAAVVHDEACDTRSHTWQATHLAFYYAMRCSGVDEIKAKIMYFAVYHYGPRWGSGYELQNPQSSKSLSVNRLTADTLNTFSDEEAQAKASDIAKWIETNNPSLRQIQLGSPFAPPAGSNGKPPIQTY